MAWHGPYGIAIEVIALDRGRSPEDVYRVRQYDTLVGYYPTIGAVAQIVDLATLVEEPVSRRAADRRPPGPGGRARQRAHP